MNGKKIEKSKNRRIEKSCFPLLVVLLASLIGCTGPKADPEKPTAVPEKPTADMVNMIGEPVVVNHRVLTRQQETILREFALKESPQLWRAVQALRADIASRDKSLAQLAADLCEFDRRSEDDVVYRELQVGREQIACTLDNVYQKLENAYLAYKKFQAMPGRKEYADVMNRALEDGVHEAEATAQRYRAMASDKGGASAEAPAPGVR